MLSDTFGIYDICQAVLSAYGSAVKAVWLVTMKSHMPSGMLGIYYFRPISSTPSLNKAKFIRSVQLVQINYPL
jgi:hypothetical protein